MMAYTLLNHIQGKTGTPLHLYNFIEFEETLPGKLPFQVPTIIDYTSITVSRGV
jgi:hypothetical protein